MVSIGPACPQVNVSSKAKLMPSACPVMWKSNSAVMRR